MRPVILRRVGIAVLVIGILTAILMSAIMLMKSSTPHRYSVTGASCIDPSGRACRSDKAVLDFIEAETTLQLPIGAELLYTRSNTNALQTAAGGYAVLSLPAGEARSAVAELEKAKMEDVEFEARSDRSQRLAELGARAVEGTFQHDQATVSVFETAEPDRRILAVSFQFYY